MPGIIQTSFQNQINAVNSAIENMQNQVDNFIAGAESTIKGWWDQIIYIATDGDDNNDGTISNPIKTIEEAISRVPNNAKATLFIKGTHIIENDIVVKSHFHILPWEESTIKFRVVDDGTYRRIKGFVFDFTGSLSFNNNGAAYFNFEILDETGSSNPFAYEARAPFKGYADWGILTPIQLAIQTNTHLFIPEGALLISAPNRHVHLLLAEMEIESDSPLLMSFSTLNLRIFNANLKDSSGNSKSWGNVLTIVRDSNGIPRNIISNIIL